MGTLVRHSCALAAAVCALLCLAAPGYADECNPPLAPADAFADADAVFVGTVIDITQHHFSVPRLLRGDWVHYAFPDADTSFSFQVEKSWKGVRTTTARIWLLNAGSGLNFSPGNRYLVYAYRGRNNYLYTHICLYSKDVRRATDELAYLSRLPMLTLFSIPALLWGSLGAILGIGGIIWFVRWRRTKSPPF